MSYLRASRFLWWLLGAAVLVSVIHYVDNYVNYEDYPLPDADAAVPAPSARLVAAGWFVLTASGLLGVVLWLRRRITGASVALVGYSLSGLIGFAHYTTQGAFDMVWWRQAHIVADILCGIAVLLFALWAARNANALTAPATRPAARVPRRAAGTRRGPASRTSGPQQLRCRTTSDRPAADAAAGAGCPDQAELRGESPVLVGQQCGRRAAGGCGASARTTNGFHSS